MTTTVEAIYKNGKLVLPRPLSLFEKSHPCFAGSVILSGQGGDDARHYQEKQVRHAIQESSR